MEFGNHGEKPVIVLVNDEELTALRTLVGAFARWNRTVAIYSDEAAEETRNRADAVSDTMSALLGVHNAHLHDQSAITVELDNNQMGVVVEAVSYFQDNPTGLKSFFSVEEYAAARYFFAPEHSE